jgi:hypothetical protein
MAYEELFADSLRVARIVLHVRAEECERMWSVSSVPAFAKSQFSKARSGAPGVYRFSARFPVNSSVTSRKSVV